MYENVMGRAGPRPITRIFSKCDGTGRAAAPGQVGPGMYENVMGRAGPRPMICGLYMGRSALPVRRLTCFDGPARAAAHIIRCTMATTNTTSTLPVRRPDVFYGQARAAAHDMWGTAAAAAAAATTSAHADLLSVCCVSPLVAGLSQGHDRIVRPWTHHRGEYCY